MSFLSHLQRRAPNLHLSNQFPTIARSARSISKNPSPSSRAQRWRKILFVPSAPYIGGAVVYAIVVVVVVVVVVAGSSPHFSLNWFSGILPRLNASEQTELH